MRDIVIALSNKGEEIVDEAKITILRHTFCHAEVNQAELWRHV